MVDKITTRAGINQKCDAIYIYILFVYLIIISKFIRPKINYHIYLLKETGESLSPVDASLHYIILFNSLT